MKKTPKTQDETVENVIFGSIVKYCNRKHLLLDPIFTNLDTKVKKLPCFLADTIDGKITEAPWGTIVTVIKKGQNNL